jgi:hypothetical protein
VGRVSHRVKDIVVSHPSGHQDRWKLGSLGPQSLEQVHASEVGQPDVNEDEVESTLGLLPGGQRVGAAFHIRHDATFRLQELTGCHSSQSLIFDEQDPHRNREATGARRIYRSKQVVR